MPRSLTTREIQVLESRLCCADDWQNIEVHPDFSPSNISHVSFSGHIYLGKNVTIHHVLSLANYQIDDDVTLFNIGELSSSFPFAIQPVQVMNENGNRSISICPDMTVGDAFLFAKFRGKELLQRRLMQFSKQAMPQLATVQQGAVIRNCQQIINVFVHSCPDAPSSIQGAISLSDGVVGYGSFVGPGVIMQRFLLGENVTIDFGARLNDTVVGDNSTIARCEVGSSLIFPAHQQHHNSSFLIAANIQGQSNMASGATVGSNHNGRTADGEIVARRGFWPALCTSVKHPSYFASYCLLAKSQYPHELNIRFPFSLVSNNVSLNRLEIMPAYWWLHNTYALSRNQKKFTQRDQRRLSLQHVEFSPFAPDTAEEILEARRLLRSYTEKAYLANLASPQQELSVRADDMERGRRHVVVLKSAQAFSAYEDMLYYYLGTVLLGTDRASRQMPQVSDMGQRCQLWANIGGQIISQQDLDASINDIEHGTITSWQQLHKRFDHLWALYPKQRYDHALQLLCALLGVTTLTQELWQGALVRFDQTYQYFQQSAANLRQKDINDPFRRSTFTDDDELHAVLD